VKLALLGATGGVGREVLSQALAAGHAVTAVVRNPSRLPADVDVLRQDLAPPDLEVLAALEDLLRDGSLDWTSIRPPRLTNGPLTRTYRTAIDRNVRHGLFISRRDVADLMLTVLHQPETVRHAIGVAY
jgi:putative NADH-flavin reductase